ncbi:uncharacterized protein LOC113851022 [Abrus precatorius]|uniref:Uncharacterized protein LOC113851022 n=1 Tax=Abrus precatorius TaxID=3816 RepID=A0A8B8K0S7_ABRPR|nr:uncharacterized protein LOC113851022 [Abrus precatorius]
MFSFFIIFFFILPFCLIFHFFSPGKGPTHSHTTEPSSSNSAKWVTFSSDKGDDPNPDPNRPGPSEKKKKKKKKKMNSAGEDDARDKREDDVEIENSDLGIGSEPGSLYPFNSSMSLVKIKEQYEKLVNCNESKDLKLDQVLPFADCLVDVRNKLQNKAEELEGSFSVTKAMFPSGRGYELRQSKLELEQKQLEEDVSVYNWLQQQLKELPAFKKMLEIGAYVENAKSFELKDIVDEPAEISFQELLEREKKDLFWQKRGKLKLGSSQ